MSAFFRSRLGLLIQLGGTLVILAFIPSTLAETAAFLVWWSITFWPLSRMEWILFVIACLSYVGGDIAMTARGVYAFSHRDIMGLPLYEPFVWGFFFLHARRMVDGGIPVRIWPGIVFGAATAAASFLLPEQGMAFAALAVLLALALACFHTRKDVQYVCYLTLIGLIVETAGIASGQWTYPGWRAAAIGVLEWSVSGIILYRGVSPLSRYLSRFGRVRS